VQGLARHAQATNASQHVCCCCGEPCVRRRVRSPCAQCDEHEQECEGSGHGAGWIVVEE
jgi:hypothetical protein